MHAQASHHIHACINSPRESVKEGSIYHRVSYSIIPYSTKTGLVSNEDGVFLRVGDSGLDARMARGFTDWFVHLSWHCGT